MTSTEATDIFLARAEKLLDRERYREALAVVSRASARRTPEPEAAALLRVVRAQALWGSGRVAAGYRELRRAAEQAASPLARARVDEASGLFAWRAQDLGRALPLTTGAREAYARHGFTQGVLRALEIETGVFRDAGRLEEAEALIQKRLALASGMGWEEHVARARVDASGLLAIKGRWQEARKELELAAELFHRLADPREFTLAGLNGALIHLAEGDLPAARQVLDRSRTIEESQGSSPRRLGECRLLFSDLHLAAGETGAARESAVKALQAFGLVKDREGEVRSRVRLSLALLEEGRVREAAQEARRGLQAAPPGRADLGALARLVLGRTLLRSRSDEAEALFDEALRLAEGRPGLAHVARLGRALGRGAGGADPEVRECLEALQKWGDRRLLAYCMADLAELGASAPMIGSGAKPQRATVRTFPDSGPAVAQAALALLSEGEWAERWCEAMRAVRTVLPWWRAAVVAVPGFELRRDMEAPAALSERDLARRIACTDAPRAVDLLADPLLRADRVRILHALAFAVVAPMAKGAALYLDFREGEGEPGDRELALVEKLARLLERHPPEVAPEAEVVTFPGILGRCPAMKAVFEQMARVAGSEETVHISGETGTGKERVARALHDRSRRKSGPFVAVNASSLSDELFEAEMFGHVRGAFTGAVVAREGLVQAAEGGTLLIDEVTDLSARAQAKMLRFLQEREYRRVGESQPRRASVRILTASNVSLDKRVQEGSFRPDLMYRLNRLVLSLPPLRERCEDVLILARHFLRAAALREGIQAPALPSAVGRALERYAWPGNIREMENEMSRLVVQSGGGPIRCEHLSPRILAAPPPPACSLRAAVLAFERDYVGRALAENGGSRVRTASVLGLTRQALLGKLKRLGL